MSDHLIDHKYTVVEIRRMRDAVKGLMSPVYWESRSRGHCGGSYVQQDRDLAIEEQLRTYMMAGIRPEDLEADLQAMRDRERAQQMAYPEGS